MKCLVDFRNNMGITQREMAEIIGVSKSLYEKIEYGQRDASKGFVKKFKRAFPDFDVNIFFIDP